MLTLNDIRAMNRKKEPPASESERLRRLKQLMNSDFSGADLTVRIRYVPENPETPGSAYLERWLKRKDTRR